MLTVGAFAVTCYFDDIVTAVTKTSLYICKYLTSFSPMPCFMRRYVVIFLDLNQRISHTPIAVFCSFRYIIAIDFLFMDCLFYMS